MWVWLLKWHFQPFWRVVLEIFSYYPNIQQRILCKIYVIKVKQNLLEILWKWHAMCNDCGFQCYHWFVLKQGFRNFLVDDGLGLP
jgi:hypothetical protein